MYAKAIRVHKKGYLLISILPPSKLHDILGKCQKGYSDYKPRL